MNYKNKLLFSDMDGTLLDSEGKVSRENREAINYFVSQGGRFGVATGRNHLNSLKYLEGIQINTPSILLNGSALYDYEEEEFLSYSQLSKEKLIPIIRWCLQTHPEIMIQIYDLNNCYIVSEKELAKQWVLDEHEPYEFISLEDIKEKHWIKILLFNDSKKELEFVADKIEEEKLTNQLSMVYSTEFFLEIIPLGVSKGNMLSDYRKSLKEEVTIYAVGDYLNDLEMLQLADVGIAMENAPKEVKEIADRITVHNDNNAIAHIIYDIMPESNQ